VLHRINTNRPVSNFINNLATVLDLSCASHFKGVTK